MVGKGINRLMKLHLHNFMDFHTELGSVQLAIIFAFTGSRGGGVLLTEKKSHTLKTTMLLKQKKTTHSLIGKELGHPYIPLTPKLKTIHMHRSIMTKKKHVCEPFWY